MKVVSKGLRRWIGIDGGGTKTSCIIGDEKGRLLTMSIGTTSNIQAVPHQRVRSTLLDLLDKVVKESQSSIENIEAVSLCLAGADREYDKVVIREFFRDTPYEDIVTIKSDAQAALASGTWAEDGLLLIAGTGSIAYGISKELPSPIRVGGWGYLLGDEGSGFYIGKRALSAVLKAFDNRELKTALTTSILKHFDFQEEKELISLYRDENIVPKIANLSKYVFEAARNEDLIAISILKDATGELAKMVKAAKAKFVSNNKVTLVLHGGLFSDEWFTKDLIEKIQIACGELAIVQAEIPAVVGAYLMAIKESGIKINEEIKSNVRSSWKEIK